MPHVTLAADTNQAIGLTQYAIDFMATAAPDQTVLDRTNLFFTDACLCGLSALALGTNAPVLLRNEATHYATPAAGFGTLGGVPWAKGCVRSG
ncbi:MAG: hypothetical protein WC718_19140, partial [Phycisphaerales bacterium]